MIFLEKAVQPTATATSLWVKLLALAFFPLYLSLSGIYPGVRSNDLVEPGGLIFPLVFYIGIGVSLYMIGRMILRREIDLPRPLVFAIFLFFGMTLVVALVGFRWSYNFLPLLMFGQNLAGGIGIGLAVYFVAKSKFDFVEICGLISKLFLFHIALHVGYSYLTIGDQTFSRVISHRTPFSGIYQILVYYPYIVSAVFWFALPYWRRFRWHLLIYLAVGLYLYCFQVRGAILSYFFTFSVYLIVFSKHRKRNALLVVAFWIACLLMVFKTNYNLARFSPSNIGQREKYWLETFESIRHDWTYLVYGTLFRGTTVAPDLKLNLNISVSSQHNQYLDYLKSGGLILLGAYAAGFLRIIGSSLRNARQFFRVEQDLIVFWFPILILIQSLIDLNVNTPLRVVNPAIYYWFYWTGSVLYLHRKAAEAS